MISDKVDSSSDGHACMMSLGVGHTRDVPWCGDQDDVLGVGSRVMYIGVGSKGDVPWCGVHA